MIKGLVLLAAVGIDVYSKRQGRPSILARFGRRGGDGGTGAPKLPGENSAQANSPAAAAAPTDS